MRTLTENLSWKLLSLCIAALLWFLLVGETEVATSMPIVVQYRNIPADLELTGDNPSGLFLKVRGPITRVSAEALSHLPLVIDVSSARGPGEQTFHITEQELGLPAGVKLIRVVPAQIRVTLDRRVTRTLPVEVRFTGPPPQGYRIVSQKVEPAQAQVTGPEYHVSRLHSVLTDPVEFSSAADNGEFQVPLYVEDPQVRIEGNKLVSVRVTLEKNK